MFCTVFVTRTLLGRLQYYVGIVSEMPELITLHYIHVRCSALCLLDFDHCLLNCACSQSADESDVNVSKCRRLMTKYCRQLMTNCKYSQRTKSLNDFSGALNGALMSVSRSLFVFR